MKNSFPHRVVSSVTYCLGSLLLLLCLSQPARATFPSGLTLSPADIGGMGLGAESYDAVNDRFTVTGKGNGFWTGLDNEHFSYTTCTGDVEIVARLLSFSYPTQGQAGLMIRKSNLPTEVNKAATMYWPGLYGTNYVAHMAFGPSLAGNANYYNIGYGGVKAALVPPYWLKLVRIGNNYGSYWSPDGRDWYLLYNNSGAALFGTGTFNIGFFVANYNGGPSTTSTAVFDQVYIGPPRLKYKTSWVGNTSGGVADGYVSNNISALWVKPVDGTCYTSGNWDELAQSVKAYKDGKVAFTIQNNAAQNNHLHEGTITGNTTNLFMATNNGGAVVYRTDFNGNSPTPMVFANPIGEVGGLAASDTRLFVSDITNQNVRIVDITMTTPTEIGAIVSPAISHPGPIAYDGTNFWITECGSDFPLTDHVTTQAGFTPAIKCFNSGGVYQSRQITGVTNPTALAKHPTLDRLYVCENGSDQNIRFYTGLLGTPAYGGYFGQPGGLWAGTHPGQITDSGYGGDKRFYGPTGVGFDSSGNIFVACNGTFPGPTGGTDLRKFDTSNNLVWKQLGLEFVSCGDFDPGTDGQEIYTTDSRFTMNYANTAPGSEWSYTAFTRNPFQANDVRNAGQVSVNGAVIRRLAGNNVFMYTDRQGLAEPCVFYRFNNQGTTGQGTTAIPWGRIYNTSTPIGFQLWIDANGDGLETSGEDTSIASDQGGYTSYDVDNQGDVWMVQNQGLTTNTPSSIGQIPCTGSQTIGSPMVATVPAYNAAGAKFFLCPAPIKALQSIKYDRANDVMYCMGQKADGKWVLVRYDKWLATSTPNEHTPRYVTLLPDRATDLTVLVPTGAMLYQGMGFAGDKVFIGDLWGPICVYDANLGNPVITLSPGPEVSASMGWQDMIMGMNVFKRSTGEYLVLMEDAGNFARNLLYRWTPTADTAVPGVPTSLTATPQGRSILLSWIGSYGTNTSYKIYRGTSSGSLSLYQSNVNTASFLDTNVTPGTTYYYKVAAVSTVGTGAQSNLASAAALSSQVEFVKYDLTTKGSWNPTGTRVYGADGYDIAGQTTSLPSYASTTARVNMSTYIWGDPSSDPNALQKVSGSGKISSTYIQASGDNQSWNVNFSDANWHQVSAYMMIDGGVHTSYVKVEVLSGTTVLDTREPMDYGTSGKWLVWNVRGNVTIRFTYGSQPPLVSGLFFDPVQTIAPTQGWWKLDETSGTTVGDSSGAGNHGVKSAGTWTAGGQINGCVTFGGHSYDSVIGLPPAALYSGSSTTLSLWFKTATNGVLIGMQNTAAGPAPTQYAPVLYVGTDNKLHGAFNTGAIQTMTSAATVTDNLWHHAAIASDGLIQRLYLDGEPVGLQVAPVIAMGFLFCGNGYVTGWPNIAGGYLYFTGLVDDVRAYSRVLPSSEIWKLKH